MEFKNNSTEFIGNNTQAEFGFKNNYSEFEAKENKGDFNFLHQIVTNNDYKILKNKPSINDVELIGNKTLDELGIQPKGNYANKGDIPTKTSDLQNDSEFATETYVENEIAKFDFIKVVDVLPETGLVNRFYLVPKTDTETQDLFDEYIWVNNNWEWIGTKQIEVDLTPYAKKEDIPDTSKFVEDENYIHTDNNYTDEDKNKLEEIGSLDDLETEDKSNLVNAINEVKNNSSGNASDISYQDNMGYAVDNVQDALDEAFNRIENINVSAIIDLGLIDMDKYDGDYDVFMSTLTETGTYKFVDSYDEFIWYVIVYNLGGSIGQTYFNSEECYNIKYNRNGYYNFDEEIYEWDDWYCGEKAYNISYDDNTGQGVLDVQNALDDVFNRLDNGYMACDIPYEDNYGYGGNNVQEALDIMYSHYDNDVATYEDLEEFRVQDLGVIDEDLYPTGHEFMDTLTEEGEYKFRDADFDYYVKVYKLGNDVLGQFYWYTEEGFNSQYNRAGYINGDTVKWHDWVSWCAWESVMNYAAPKSHVHYETVNNVDDIRTWLDDRTTLENKEYHINQKSDGHKFIVKLYWDDLSLGTSADNIRYFYQEYFEIEEPSKIYKRVGTRKGWASTTPITWGKWYVFEGVAE